jgi:O-acetylhomoserine (thiol)-lyase
MAASARGSFRTRTIHAGLEPDPATGAILAPIHQSATFVQAAVGRHKGFTYTRCGNPTVAALERLLGALEEAPQAVCFGTGMAAIGSSLIALLRAGDHIVSSAYLFGNTNSLFATLQNLGIGVTFVDATDAANVAAAITPNTRVVFVETIANPVTQVCDLDGIGKLCAERVAL